MLSTMLIALWEHVGRPPRAAIVLPSAMLTCCHVLHAPDLFELQLHGHVTCQYEPAISALTLMLTDCFTLQDG